MASRGLCDTDAEVTASRLSIVSYSPRVPVNVILTQHMGENRPTIRSSFLELFISHIVPFYPTVRYGFLRFQRRVRPVSLLP